MIIFRGWFGEIPSIRKGNYDRITSMDFAQGREGGQNGLEWPILAPWARPGGLGGRNWLPWASSEGTLLWGVAGVMDREGTKKSPLLRAG